MTSISTSLERASHWDEICFPIQTLPLQELLPVQYELIATDRQTAIVGESSPGQFQVFALQGKDYSLIPNQLLRSVIDRCIENYTVDIQYTGRGEFSIAIILPEQVRIGEEKIYKSLIINNSYNGKTPFTIQGSTLQSQSENRSRISFYRNICNNGLMGWADDFSTLDEYDQWLKAGRPKITKVEAMASKLIAGEPKEGEPLRKVSHKRLDMEVFPHYLSGIIHRFLAQKSSTTAQVYGRLSQVAVPKQAQTLITEVGLPKQLGKQAMERLRKEEKLLRSEPTLWLIYNAINYSLLNSRSSLTINDRYEWDEKALHHLAALSV